MSSKENLWCLAFVRFDIGAVESSNLYSSHAKITSSKGDLLDYLLKITREPNANGQLKFILKDTVAANGNFKVSDSDGKGNGLVIVDFKKVGNFVIGLLKIKLINGNSLNSYFIFAVSTQNQSRRQIRG